LLHFPLFDVTIAQASYTFSRDFLSLLRKDDNVADFGRTSVLLRGLQRVSIQHCTREFVACDFHVCVYDWQREKVEFESEITAFSMVLRQSHLQ